MELSSYFVAYRNLCHCYSQNEWDRMYARVAGRSHSLVTKRICVTWSGRNLRKSLWIRQLDSRSFLRISFIQSNEIQVISGDGREKAA